MVAGTRWGRIAIVICRDYLDLGELDPEGEAAVAGWTPDQVNAFVGRDFLFETPGSRTEFKAEVFLLSFSLPNFHFHLITAYDILRQCGVEIGKRDFMGTPPA